MRYEEQVIVENFINMIEEHLEQATSNYEMKEYESVETSIADTLLVCKAMKDYVSHFIERTDLAEQLNQS